MTVPGPKDCKAKRYGQQAIKYITPSQWNALPRSIRETDSIHSFWSTLKTHLVHSL